MTEPTNKAKPSRWNAQNALIKFDNFGIDIPAFNLNGEKKVKTLVGGFVTVALLCILLIFSVNSFVEMIDRKYPIVQDIKIEDHFTSDDKLNLNKIGHHFAFTFEGRNGTRLDDPKYVKILVRYRQLSANRKV